VMWSMITMLEEKEDSFHHFTHWVMSHLLPFLHLDIKSKTDFGIKPYCENYFEAYSHSFKFKQNFVFMKSLKRFTQNIFAWSWSFFKETRIQESSNGLFWLQQKCGKENRVKSSQITYKQKWNIMLSTLSVKLLNWCLQIIQGAESQRESDMMIIKLTLHFMGCASCFNSFSLSLLIPFITWLERHSSFNCFPLPVRHIFTTVNNNHVSCMIWIVLLSRRWTLIHIRLSLLSIYSWESQIRLNDKRMQKEAHEIQKGDKWYVIFLHFMRE
jgi:hypothetical protein